MRPMPTVKTKTMVARVSPEPVIDIAERMLGIPYVHQSATWAGVDCTGLLRLIWKEWTGLPVPVIDVPVAKDWHISHPRLMLDGVGIYMDQVTDDPQPGDALLFCTGGSEYPRHAGVLSRDPHRMIHAYAARTMDRQHVCVSRYRTGWGAPHSIWRFRWPHSS